MKKLVFAFCMLFGAAVAVNAQDTTSTTSPTDPTSMPSTAVEQDQDGRVKIKSQDLPDAVKKSLESQEYRGWLVNAAYKVDAASGQATDTPSDPSSASGSSSSSTSGQATTQTETGAQASESYIIELKNGAQTKTVRFDKDGNKLDDEDMKDDQK